MNTIITADYLTNNPLHVFVFGDNLIKRGKAGAARFRDFKNTYGFVTKKYPNNDDSSFYRPLEYIPIFQEELSKLCRLIAANSNHTYLISKLGGGLANKYQICETVIIPGLSVLRLYPNTQFLF